MAITQDAGLFVQQMVDKVIVDQLNEIHKERQVALSFRQLGNNYYIKLLCFNDNPANCVHVKIRVDRDGINHYAGRAVGMMMVENAIDAEEIYQM